MSKRISTRKNWDDFWERKKQVEDVYSNEERIIVNLSQHIDLKGKRILEVGAGTARDSFAMVEAGADVYVLDYSLPAFNIINRLNKEQAHHVVPLLADTFKIPASDNTFDVVFHQGLLEHFENPLELLQENIRVLKKGGILLVDVPQKYHIYTIIKHIFILLGKWFAGWETQFTLRELKSLVERSGANVVRSYGAWMRPSLFYRMSREALLKIGIKLPLYPEGPKPIRKLRNRIRDYLLQKTWVLYTVLDLGIIAKKL